MLPRVPTRDYSPCFRQKRIPRQSTPVDAPLGNNSSVSFGNYGVREPGREGGRAELWIRRPIGALHRPARRSIPYQTGSSGGKSNFDGVRDPAEAIQETARPDRGRNGRPRTFFPGDTRSVRIYDSFFPSSQAGQGGVRTAGEKGIVMCGLPGVVSRDRVPPGPSTWLGTGAGPGASFVLLRIAAAAPRAPTVRLRACVPACPCA